MGINKLRAERPPEKKSYPGIKLSTECVYLNLLERLNDASSEFCTQIAGRRRPHAKLVARNRAVLASLQPTCSARAFRTVPPQELTDAAHKAARLTDTRTHTNRQPRIHLPPLVPKPSLGPRRLTTLCPPYLAHRRWLGELG